MLIVVSCAVIALSSYAVQAIRDGSMFGGKAMSEI